MNTSSFWAIFTSLSTIQMNKVGYASLLSLHGMPTIGILNPPRAIEKRKCKPCANIMNKKLFMAHKFAKTFVFLAFFFIVHLNHGTNFFGP
jgi:hypothetical protein